MGGGVHKRVSKFLSYVLRHHPESIELQLDEHGWAPIEELRLKASREGYDISRSLILDIINSGDKQRFILNDDEKYVRATYGHSIDVDLQLHASKPPEILFHGTARRHRSSILKEGIRPGSRNFVHLSATTGDAREVGARHGIPVVLQLRSRAMFQQGYLFFQSESEAGIWLTKEVLPSYLITN